MERLAGETLVYDEARDTAHCLGEPAATVFGLCDGARSRAALAALAAKRLGRPFGERELDGVLGELGAIGLLDGESGGRGLSRRQALVAGGGIAAASLVTSIVAPVPAMAQSPAPPAGPEPGSPGAPCQTTPDCNQDLQCQNSECCVPDFGPCSSRSDCCGADQNPDIQCAPLVQGSNAVCFVNQA